MLAVAAPIVKNSSMTESAIRTVLYSPLGRRLLWVLFAVLFYQSGEATLIWLLEPTNFEGGWNWIWVALFTILLPAFFALQPFFGCASGDCQTGACKSDKRANSRVSYSRPPG
jgi:uncharacterized membrane protein HdeD (DUF308 family)